MPHQNHFRHQPYHGDLPSARHEILSKPLSIEPTQAGYEDELNAACHELARQNLAAIYLVHGTFVGNDFLGVLTEMRRFWPSLAEVLRSWSKGLVNAVVGETGNYTPEFAATFERAMSTAAGREIPVELFNWSSQNNHIGRADGAVRLIAQLAELAEAHDNSPANPPRVMLWAHSHGGNVLALVTNLLAAEHDVRERFFDVAETFYKSTLTGRVDMPAWQRVRELLATDHPVRRLALDIVTFGTPIRYGWDRGGYANLLHFVNHRPADELPAHRTRHPLRPLHFMSAKHGDYMHQIGIAGTNLIPLPLALRTFLADRRLQSLLQGDVTWRGLFRRYAHGQRLHHEGLTLLVDYGDDNWLTFFHLAGHAAYTRSRWLPFHVAQIAERFYGPQASI